MESNGRRFSRFFRAGCQLQTAAVVEGELGSFIQPHTFFKQRAGFMPNANPTPGLPKAQNFFTLPVI